MLNKRLYSFICLSFVYHSGLCVGVKSGFRLPGAAVD
jgi:hypothetical protein